MSMAMFEVDADASSGRREAGMQALPSRHASSIAQPRRLPHAGYRGGRVWAALVVACLSAMPHAYAADTVEPGGVPASEQRAVGTASVPLAAQAPLQGGSEPAAIGSEAQSAVALLAKVQQAARQLDYQGVYTYSQDGFTQSSRLIHMRDGTGSRERLEILDGEPREYVRHNEDVQCLLPDRKQVLVERRRSDRFPGVLLGDPAGLTANYSIAVEPTQYRVAGRKCQLITITPHDGLRYGYRLCVDVQSSLLLKAQTVDADNTLIEQVMFTSLRVGNDIDPEALRPSWSTQGWQVVHLDMPAVDLSAKGWRVPPPEGFMPLMQVQRAMGQSDDVGQIVFSDGLAAISVFIEPYHQAGMLSKKPGASRLGAVNIYTARIADFWLTALGEVPVPTLQQLVESTEYVLPPE